MSIAQQFLQLAIKKNVLKLGEFTLKSGRVSPYFFNAGLFDDGQSLQLLGDYFAQTIAHSGIKFDGLFGPAYKGIPLATTIAVAYYHRYQRNIPVSFNRKEVKSHGEGGALMGAPLKGRILIVDDVVSAGTSVRQSINIISQAGAEPVAVAVALDRQEKGENEHSAMQELATEFALQTTSIAGLDDLLALLPDNSVEGKRITEYRQKYGV
ncbi:MAG: orotate phosphoribosyltransferase [Proteobacteria bacterium]|nr:MAG: orotate phosphoribosyltransferase [Pseudomonadota bacterium]